MCTALPSTTSRPRWFTAEPPALGLLQLSGRREELVRGQGKAVQPGEVGVLVLGPVRDVVADTDGGEPPGRVLWPALHQWPFPVGTLPSLSAGTRSKEVVEDAAEWTPGVEGYFASGSDAGVPDIVTTCLTPSLSATSMVRRRSSECLGPTGVQCLIGASEREVP